MTPSRPATSRLFSDDYVGLPFAWNGYTRAGVSCWGLIVLVYREVYGVRLPRHDQLGARVADGDLPESADPWLPPRIWDPVELGDEREGDLLHMRGVNRGRIHSLHCGVVVRPGFVLHAEEKIGTHVARYRSGTFANRVLGAYRCRLI